MLITVFIVLAVISYFFEKHVMHSFTDLSDLYQQVRTFIKEL